jgi:hypothetical protein
LFVFDCRSSKFEKDGFVEELLKKSIAWISARAIFPRLRFASEIPARQKHVRSPPFALTALGIES